jgi:hypothetical protein
VRGDRQRGEGERRTDGLLGGVEVADESGHVEATDIPDHGTSVSIKSGLLLLVQLVIQEEVSVVSVEPALVSVLGAGVAIAGEGRGGQRREGERGGGREGEGCTGQGV